MKNKNSAIVKRSFFPVSRLGFKGKTFLYALGFTTLIISPQIAMACTSPNAVEGSLYYNSTDDEYEYCDGTNWIDWGGGGGGGGSGIWEYNSGTVRLSSSGAYATNDFVFGSPTLDYSSEASRMFFDKSKSAFRAGSTSTAVWNDVNIGTGSAAFGNAGVTASGTNSMAWGDPADLTGAIASGSGATSWGNSSEASALSSTAFGRDTEASNSYATAWGGSAGLKGGTASGIGSTAFGVGTTASGPAATAWGLNTQASGDYATAFGNNTTASGLYSLATGNSSEAGGEGSLATGVNNTASGYASTALGDSNVASGYGSTAFGREVAATGGSSVAVGLHGGAQTTDPVVSGSQSFGIFMDNGSNDATSGMDLSADNYLAVVGGRLMVSETEDHTLFDNASGGGTIRIEGDASFLTVGNGATSSKSDLDILRSRGTNASRLKVEDGDSLGSVRWAGWDGNSYESAAQIEVLVDGATGDEDVGGRLAFNTRADGATGSTTHMTIDQEGAIFIGNTSDTGEEIHIGPLASGSSDTAISIENNGHIYQLHVDEDDSFAVTDENEDPFLFIDGTNRAVAFGKAGSTATNNNDMAWGENSTASGGQSTAFGNDTTASGNEATAFGQDTTASGHHSLAYGREVVASGESSTGIGLHSEANAQTTDPIVSGDRSMVLFFGRNTADSNSGYDFTETDKFALIGGEFQIDDVPGSANKGCIRYNSGTARIQFSHDCSAYSDFGSGGGGGGGGLWSSGSGSDIYYTSGSGNVGVGTSTPLSRLTVGEAGTLGIETNDTDVQDGDLVGQIDFRSNEASTDTPPTDDIVAQMKVVAEKQFTSGDWGNAITFSNMDGSSNTLAERLRIDQDGNVGIGTATPASLLHIHNNTADAEFVIEGNEDDDSQLLLLTSGDGASTDDADSSHWIITARGNNHSSSTDEREDLLWEYWDGSSYSKHFLMEHDTGHVGLGTSTPDSNLHIEDAGDAPELRLSGPGSATSQVTFEENGQGENWYIKYVGSGNTFMMGTDATVTKDWFEMARDTGALILRSELSAPATPGSGSLVIRNDETGGGAHASALIKSAINGTGGDAYLAFDIPNERGWTFGVDNSDGDKLKFGNWPTVNTDTIMTLTTAQQVGIGTTDPDTTLEVRNDNASGDADVMKISSNGGPILRMENADDGVFINPRIMIERARGSLGSETAVVDDDEMFELLVRGHDGTNFENIAGITVNVDGAVGNNDVPGRIRLFTDDNGTSAGELVLNSAGHLILNDGDTADNGDQQLMLDVEGPIGATHYCDEDGANCVAAGALGGGGSSLWEDNSGVIRSTSGTVDYSADDFVFGSPQLDDTSDSDHDARMFFDKSRSAFRAGRAQSSQWNSGNVGTDSAAFGQNNTASGQQSFATGFFTVASGDRSATFGGGTDATGERSAAFGSDTTASGATSMAWGGDIGTASGPTASGLQSTAWGFNNSTVASGELSTAFGNRVRASGINATAWGREVRAGSGTALDGAGDYSVAVGLQSGGHSTDPIISGDRSFVLFMDGGTANANDGYDFAADDKFALIGGEFQIDDVSSSANKGCIRYDSASTKLQFSHDCSAYSDFGSGGGGSSLWTAGADDIIYYTSGDAEVGIGTSTPAKPLHIYNVDSGLIVEGDEADDTNIQLLTRGDMANGISNAATNGWLFRGWGNTHATAANQDDFDLTYWDGTTGIDIMFIEHDTGNVGIGTTTPADEMHLYRDAADAVFRIEATGSNDAKISFENDDNDWNVGTEDGTDSVASGNFVIRDATAGSTVVVVEQATGDVGIGVADPGFPLHVHGDIIADILTADGGNFAEFGMAIDGTESSYMGIHKTTEFTTIVMDTDGDGTAGFGVRSESGDTDTFTILDSGNVGIFNTSPGVELDVTGDIEYTGTITDVSDIRLKENVQPLGSSLEKLGMIDTYSFTMKDDEKGQVEFGVMAQELEQIFPELVRTADDEMGTKSVNYTGLIAPMIEATKELRAENEVLRQEVSTLKAERDEVVASIDELRSDVKGLKAHTGYEVNKAQVGLWFGLGMVLSALAFGLGLVVRRRKNA